MCVLYQFLQCFVGFERTKTRTRARGDKPRKSMRFGLKNRARERRGEPKSGSTGQGRAAKPEKSRTVKRFFFCGAIEAVGARKGRAAGRVGALMPEAPGAPSKNLDRDFVFIIKF